MNTNGDERLAKLMHERRTDPERFLFQCDKCYGRFETRKSLQQHQDRKLFKCPFKDCCRKFTHRWELVTHQKQCPGRVLQGDFDNYKIYQMINIRHTEKPRKFNLLDLWVKYPYWF
ncbi:uncharacterized protein LOC124496501 [Dermatophagoides farinae]|uniref:C2H2-type domain-containing protein n=1 Tax=Dermatophagoides farinae TaxID=6954 RepID=A0A922LC16_DERFA|nr:uncharacterized protein LOC124496501 isoform X1 [Dermatophagoides farinae]KAH7638289.1 hypothetical protein HUG17_9395 [Dermatophagoides farinae]KAH9530288.1 hypothetical protein DERF_004100 [Dermatophagoides farinae]